MVIAYARRVIVTGDQPTLRDLLNQPSASRHADCRGGEATALISNRDVRPFLPGQTAGSMFDNGCGLGQLVRLLLVDGYDQYLLVEREAPWIPNCRGRLSSANVEPL